MSQPIMFCPFKKFGLRNHFRPQPNCFLQCFGVELTTKSRRLCFWQVDEWARRHLRCFSFSSAANMVAAAREQGLEGVIAFNSPEDSHNPSSALGFGPRTLDCHNATAMSGKT